MKPPHRRRPLAEKFTAALVFCCVISALQADTLYWDGNDTSADANGGTGTWNTANTNWDTTSTGGSNTTWNNATPDSAVFGGVAGTVTLGQAMTAGGIQIDTAGYTITASTLTIHSGGVTVTSGANNAGGFTDLSSAIVLGDNQSWVNQSSNTVLRQLGSSVNLGANTLTLEGAVRVASGISGSGNIIINYSGGAFAGMSSNNTFSGTTTINSGGILLINNLTNSNVTGGLGVQAVNSASNLVLNGGTLRVQVSTGSSNRLFTLGANGGTLDSLNAGIINLNNTGAVAVTGNGNRTLTLTGNNAATTNNISLSLGDSSGSGIVSLAKSGAAAWEVSGNNSFSGGTTLNNGILRTNHANALGSTSGSLTVHGGTLELNDFNRTVGNLTGSGGTIANNLTGAVTLTIGQGDTGGGNFQGEISDGSGTVALTKTGGGTITLSGTNTYTGATNITGGTLIVDGSISNSSLTTVGFGATLEGTGTTGALTISAGGFHNPGNSPGIMETGTYNMAGTLTTEINGITAGSQHDQIGVTGSITLSGDLNVIFSGGTYANGNLIFILLNDGSDAISGMFNNYAQGDYVATYGGFDWTISYLAHSDANTFTGGNDIALLATAVIPEPAAALFGGIGMLMLLRRRRN